MAARNLGAQRRAAAVRARDAGAGLAAACDPLLLHCYCDPSAEPNHVYLREAVSLRKDLHGRAMTGIEFNRHIEEIPIYPAASTYAFEGELVKLASNETPYPPHPQVLEAIEAQLRTLNRYPDPEKSLLRAAHLRAHRRPDRQRGGRQRLLRDPAGGRRGDARAGRRDRLRLALVLDVPAAGRDVRRHGHHRAAHDAGEHDLEAMAAQVTAATRLVIVCNPNNPSATALPPATIDAWVAELPRHVAVVVDEAYVEFSALQDPDDSLDLVGRHPNLVLLRTFSKVYGLCGLRAGYALCPESFRLAVDRVRQPFSVNALAQAAATEALNHQDEVERRVEQNVIERVHVESELQGAASRPPTARPTSRGCRSATATRTRSSTGSRARA